MRSQWTLGSISTNKASGDDRISTELLQVLENDAVKGLHSICRQIWKTQWSQDWKRYSNPKEGQCQRRLKLLHNCTYLTHQQSSTQNSPSQASTVHESWTSRCSSWISKKAKEPEIKLPTSLDYRKTKRVSEEHLFLLYWLPKPLTVWITTNCGRFWKRWEYQADGNICLLRNLYAGQEATVRT